MYDLDLDVGNTMEEAKSRWLRPNEIHAILCNYKYFTIHVKPVNLPKSNHILLLSSYIFLSVSTSISEFPSNILIFLLQSIS